MSAEQAENTPEVSPETETSEPVNQNKVLTPTEVEEFKRNARREFDRVDLDKSGYIDIAEFEKEAGEDAWDYNREEGVAELKKIDTDDDGKVSYDEFCDALLKVLGWEIPGPMTRTMKRH